MNKKALLDYALFARKELETQIALSLNRIGIYKDHVSYAHIVGDRTIIEGIAESFDKRIYDLRKRISEVYLKEQKFEILVEEFAYTWFNRIVAIRFMELHDYFSHGFRVLSSRDGSYEPEILKNLPYVVEELNLNVDVIQSLKDQNKIEELYRYVLIKQCNALNPIFPELFDKQDSCLEFLLPNNLLGADSVIRKISVIPEEDFMNDIEVVGWLYQFYNSVKKDEVFASKKTITKDTLPAVTQLFTPDWIVRYMADNSVGRLWLESYPNSSIMDELKYYVEDAEQDEETNKKLEQIRYKNVDPETIKVIEPCCGSGHILVYVFDLLYKMYLEKGYNSKDIPSLILKNNLYGLDVDKRAAQLAQFSLIMKARSIDNRFFSSNRFVFPNVYDFKDSQLLIDCGYESAMTNLHFSKKSIELAKYLVETFRNAKVIGSLLKVESKDYSLLLNDIQKCINGEFAGIFEQDFYHLGIPHLKQLISLAKVISNKYDVMITNPPYIGISSLDESAKNYAAKQYVESKTDMFAMFMRTCFTKLNGFKAIINMHSWMFLDSYEKLRLIEISSTNIINMMHLGPHAFETIGGEVVQTTAFVSRNTPNIEQFKTTFIRLVNYDYQKKILEFSNKDNVFNVSVGSFVKIPSFSFSYWLSDSIINAYSKFKLLGDYGSPKKGLSTGDNDRFLRLWFEVDKDTVCLSNEKDISKKWFLLNKGGTFRKWYGNNEFVINYQSDGYELKKFKGSVIRNEPYYFKESLTWSMLSSNTLSARFSTSGKIFEGAGPSLFIKGEKMPYTLAVLCSKVGILFVKSLNPTLNININDIANIPINFDGSNFDRITQLANENIKLSKIEWDSYETSYDFDGLSFIGRGLIEDYVIREIDDRNKLFNKVKNNEIEINKLLIEEYDLENELNADVLDSDISIKKLDKQICVKQLLSYLIGCIMGRYVLDRYEVPKDVYLSSDGIVPIYNYVGIKEGLTEIIVNLINKLYGDTYFDRNLDFIAESLGRKSDEGAIDALNRYLNSEFYNDHLQTFKTKSTGSRPIYWMMSSGKYGAFKALIYSHKYSKYTLAKLNSLYFLPRTALYKTERERLQFSLKTSLDSRQKKAIEKDLLEIENSETELLEYGQVLDHMANKYIDINLDDGVKTNYCKFQGISLEVNGATIKKDLLVPFGLEKK